jgi:putative transposase
VLGVGFSIIFSQNKKRRYEAGEKHLSHFDICKEITALKKQPDTAWLKEMDAVSLQSAAEDISIAYKNFFDSVKKKRKGAVVGHPKARANIHASHIKQSTLN